MLFLNKLKVYYTIKADKKRKSGLKNEAKLKYESRVVTKIKLIAAGVMAEM